MTWARRSGGLGVKINGTGWGIVRYSLPTRFCRRLARAHRGIDAAEMRETGSEQETRKAGFTSRQGETDGKRQSTQFLWQNHGAQCFLGRCPQILRSANAACWARGG